MAAGRIDAIALTNLGQIRRLIEVARARGCEDRLRKDSNRRRSLPSDRPYPMN
jgi:uroporphyrinogen-III synthase